MPLSVVQGEVKPTSVEQTADGSWVYAFPKNFVGTVKVAPLPFAENGSKLEILAGEWLDVPPPPSPSNTTSWCAVVPEGQTAYLGCGGAGDNKIASVTFASFGLPSGDCAHGNFELNASCDRHAVASNASLAHVRSLCVGRRSCAVKADATDFGGNPCGGVVKRLAVSVRCASDPPGPLPPPPPVPPPNPSVPAISGSIGQWQNHTLRSGNGAALETLFCWHGYQYVRVTSVGNTGFRGRLEDVVGLEIRTTLTSTGTLLFGSSSSGGGGGGGGAGEEEGPGVDRAAAMSNGLNAMILNSQVANVAAYLPTDCPTREKHGWMGDALDVHEQAMYNFDMRAVFEAFLQTVEDNQDPASGDVPFVVPTAMHPSATCKDIAWTSAYPQIARYVVTLCVCVCVNVFCFSTFQHETLLYCNSLTCLLEQTKAKSHNNCYQFQRPPPLLRRCARRPAALPLSAPLHREPSAQRDGGPRRGRGLRRLRRLVLREPAVD
jgi:hypothetical protein